MAAYTNSQLGTVTLCTKVRVLACKRIVTLYNFRLLFLAGQEKRTRSIYAECRSHKDFYNVKQVQMIDGEILFARKQIFMQKNLWRKREIGYLHHHL